MLKRRKFKLIMPWLLAALIVVIFFGPRIYGTIKNNFELGKKINELQKNIKDLEAKNANLGKFIANFKKQDYIEKEAKTRLNLKKPGEKVVIIVEEEIKKTEEEVKEKWFGIEKLKEFWQKIRESWK